MATIVKFNQIGGPEVLSVVDGDPGELGDGEVLLKIDAIGLNRAEAAIRGGHYIFQPTFPALLGGEASGRILKLGTGVKGWAPGDAVSTLPLFPPGKYGVYASEAIVPASCLLKLPEGLDPVQSAATWMAYLTAWGGMVETGKLKKGEFVIITAASSSVGLAALQIARDLGAVPIATTRRRNKADALFKAGAQYVIATEEDDVLKEIGVITRNKGVRLIFDPVAGPFAETLFQGLANEGMLLIYGGLANQPAIFPRHAAIRGNLTMRGYNFSSLVGDKDRLQVARDSILERLRDGRFKMPIAHRFKLTEVVEAHRFMEANQHVGKIVMIP